MSRFLFIVATIVVFVFSDGTLAALNVTGPQTANQESRSVSKEAISVAPAPLQNVHPPGWHPPRFKGFVDLHTHPMSYLGFGGKLMWGGLDVGSYLPTDSKCVHDTTAKSMQQALATDNSVRGGWGAFDNPCGDDLRKIFFRVFESANNADSVRDWARGYPADYTQPSHDGKDFMDWPNWKDIDHQKMWVDSIHRAYVGGLRVMVALAVNNKTLADAVRGPGDKLPDNDKDSAALQIQKTKEFVKRHQDFMEIAYSPRDLERIVRANKLAVILGVEVDNIGDINRVQPLTQQAVSAAIHDLYNHGVRYIFPIHVIDNPLGGTAVYIDTFNRSNYAEAGHYWNVECSQPADGITYEYPKNDFWTQLEMNGFSLVKLGSVPPSVPNPPSCPPGTGLVNKQGMTPLGEYAIKEMMKLGMLIDIDHMSNKTAERAIEIAENVDPPGTKQISRGTFQPGGPIADAHPSPYYGYPLFSGHNGLRGGKEGHGTGTEINRTPSQYQRLARMHGMAGVGTAGLDAEEFLHLYGRVIQATGYVPAAFGTDTDGFVVGMPPRIGSHVAYNASFPMSRMGSKQWDYNRSGVAHYGMIADFVKDMESIPGATGLIEDNLMNGADYFLDSWIQALAQSKKVH
jgi:microsomal dipeptidase-like Zn-dependent dipeptidase